MVFSFTVFIFLLCDGLLIWYLANSNYFDYLTAEGEIDSWNIVFFVFLVAAALGLVVSLVVFWGEKILICGKREMPSAKRGIKYGFLTAIVFFGVLLLHIFHLLNFFVGILLSSLLVVGIILLR